MRKKKHKLVCTYPPFYFFITKMRIILQLCQRIDYLCVNVLIFVLLNIYGLKVEVTLLRLYNTYFLKLRNKNISLKHHIKVGIANQLYNNHQVKYAGNAYPSCFLWHLIDIARFKVYRS
jgi:hypothetical protein